jgi:hypothetical protein
MVAVLIGPTTKTTTTAQQVTNVQDFTGFFFGILKP